MEKSSLEQLMTTELLPENYQPVGEYFGTFFDFMRLSLVSGGSELGLGMTLFSLAVSIKAVNIVEIGRFKGFSTLCLASALKFLDIGWQEPQQHKQRPDINYPIFEAKKQRKLFSIDPFPTQEAENLLKQAGVIDYVELINARSDEIELEETVDLIFIDGDHSYEGCLNDVLNYVPWYLKPGGYFILHDYFGWYDREGNNNSPVKKVIDQIREEGRFESILMDTGYQSFVIFRNPVD